MQHMGYWKTFWKSFC